MSNKVSTRNIVLAVTGAIVWLIGRQFMRHRGASNLMGQVVLIAGGSRGVGFLMAQEFALQGSKLIICARNQQELERAREDLAQQGADVLAIPCDITKEEQVQQMVNSATAHYGQIDVLVNNAGIITVGPFLSQATKEFEDSMNDMFWGPYYTIKAVLPQMLQRQQGRIVNITSIGGKISVPHLLSYSSAKFALVGFSEGLHAEMAREGIKVVTVVPGLMRTGSAIRAYFLGNKHREEFTLFDILDSLPFISMSAKKAAQQIVQATARGDAEIILSFPAKVAVRLHGLLPGFTSTFFGWIDRLLPKASPGSRGERYTGEQSETTLSQSFLTELNQKAARKYNEIPEQH